MNILVQETFSYLKKFASDIILYNLTEVLSSHLMRSLPIHLAANDTPDVNTFSISHINGNAKEPSSQYPECSLWFLRLNKRFTRHLLNRDAALKRRGEVSNVKSNLLWKGGDQIDRTTLYQVPRRVMHPKAHSNG